MAVSLEELNFLVWRYLKENGFEHSAFLFECESCVDTASPAVPSGALVTYLQKSLQSLRLEKRLAAMRRSTSAVAHLEARFPEQAVAPEPPPPINPTDRIRLSAEVATVLASHRASVYSARWSVNGRQLATASSDGTAIIWSMANETPTHHVVLSAQTDGPVTVDHDITCLSWSPSGSLLATGSLDSHVRLYTDAGKQLFLLSGHKNHVFAVQFNPTGELLLSAGADHAAIVWKADTGQLLQRFVFHADTVLAVAWKDGQCFATGSADCGVGVCVVGRSFSLLKGHSRHVNAVAYSPSGAVLASASDDGTVRLWTPGGSEVLSPHLGGVTQVEWAGETVVVAGSMNGEIRVWDAPRRACARVIDHGQQGLISMALSPGGAFVVSGSQDQKVAVSRIADGGRVATFAGNSDVYDVAWDPTGRFVAACFDDSTVAIIPVAQYARALP